MLSLNRLLARPSAVRRLLSAAGKIKRAADQRLPGLRWAVRGSTAIGEAICPSLTGDLDLDVFAVSVPHDPLGSIAAVFEAVSLACEAGGWELEQKPLGFRVTVHRKPLLSLDVGIICARGNRVHRVALDGRFVEATDVLHRHHLTREETTRSFVRDWMNLKHWAKNAVPWQAYPGSHVVRSIFREASKSCTLGAVGWRGYLQRVERSCELAEGKDFIRKIERTATVTTRTIEVMPQFCRYLRAYSDDIHRLSPQEHVEYGDRLRSRRQLHRVFVSSRQREFAALRAVLSSRKHGTWTLLVAETFFPWDDSVSNGMTICDAFVDEADLFVGVYGESYGTPSPGRRGAPIEEELSRAMTRLQPHQVVLFELCGAEREPALTRMLQEHTDGRLLPLHQDIDSAAKHVENTIESAVRGGPVHL